MGNYLYIFLTIIFTLYGQLVLKWRINYLGTLYNPLDNKIKYVLRLLSDPFILSGFLSAFIAAVFWMLTISKFEISKAYPFMSICPPLVFIFSVTYLNESFTWGKIIGLILIVCGIIATVKL